jgi:hypothetical protein
MVQVLPQSISAPWWTGWSSGIACICPAGHRWPLGRGPQFVEPIVIGLVQNRGHGRIDR